MIHLGDIKNMKGETTPIVDVVTGGSPCQDLSVAGKRAGMAGERSGLFMEQIRLIKEMREYDRTTNHRAGIFIRPRFMVWENVPGAFSSNNGEDFRAVLEETAKIADPNAVIPRPSGRWSKAGCVLGDGWSIAWRVHDAQFWGVPQRRKRISLIADFGGGAAPEILFERKSVSGDFESSGTTEKETSRSPQDGIGGAISFQERAGCDGGGKGILIQKERTGALSTLNNQSVLAGCDVYNHAITGDVAVSLTAESGGVTATGPKIMILNDQGGGIMSVTKDKTATLRAQEHGHPPIVYGMSSFDSNAMKSANPKSGIYEAETSRTLDLQGGNHACNQGGMIVLEGNGSRPSHKVGGFLESETMYTLNSTEQHAVFYDAYQHHGYRKNETCGTLTADQNNSIRGDTPLVTYQNVTGTIDCGISKGTNNQLANTDMFVANGQHIRRLTPMECERLQGFPDNWTNIGEWVDSKGKRHKEADSPRYKALGNSIALPYWFWLLRRISAQYERPATLGSLFDGIGGFPLCWERCNGKGTAIWASEIEEFPIAVTKYHFPE